MRFTDVGFARHCRWAVVALLTGCSTPLPPDRPLERPVDRAADRPPAEAPSGPPSERPPAPAATTPPAAPAGDRLPAPQAVRNWAEVRQQAARRLVAANPQGSYTGRVPDILLAIPVLEVELHADGQIRRIVVLRVPKQAQDTTQLAIAALHRAAPFGDVSRLPKPWRFTETFLFNDERRFKPRTLD